MLKLNFKIVRGNPKDNYILACEQFVLFIDMTDKLLITMDNYLKNKNTLSQFLRSHINIYFVS